MQNFDIIVIGAGIAGVSVAAHLAETRNVVILEMEQRAGYHATGRSAASFAPNYGPPAMQAFTRGSEEFFREPPEGFADAALFTPRDTLFLMPKGQEDAAENLLATGSGLAEISGGAAQEIFPVLHRYFAKRIFLDPATGDLDVDQIHRGYLRLFRQRGGMLALASPVKGLLRRNGLWSLATPEGIYAAPIVINAAGAWGDQIAKIAGVKPVGLVPKRRSIGVVPVANDATLMDWPLVMDVAETWYCKPQSGKLLVSSADATPVEPHDAFADDIAVAEGVECLMRATTLRIDRVEYNWGGLRTFAPDGNPVVGFDPVAEGFFWLVGQGGYGVQSSPGLSQTAAAMILGYDIPSAVEDHGLNLSHVSPQRFIR